MKSITKKKTMKIAISTAVAASAFVAAAPSNLKAEASVNVNTLVGNAINAGTVLKWAISKEGSADFQTRPYDEYNTAKKAIQEAEKAVSGLSESKKLQANAQLVDSKIQLKRAQNYIDAITSSEKIIVLTKDLDKSIKSGDLNDVEASYHKSSSEYRKQAILLDRVYGQSTRDGIRNAVKPALEKLLSGVKYDVTVKTHLDKAYANVQQKDFAKASLELEKANYNLTLKEAKFTFKPELEKAYKEILNSIKLDILTVVADGKNEVTLKLNKPYDEKTVLKADMFKIKDLAVKSMELSADKKTVTLKTAEQESGKEYTLTWEGKSYKFTTPKDGNKTVITVDSQEVFLETMDSRSYSVKFANADGTPYGGTVSIDLTKNKTERTSAVITSVNGRALDKSQSSWKGTPDKNGNLVFTVSAASSIGDTTRSATHVQPEIKKMDGDVVSKLAGMTHFLKLQNLDTTKNLTVSEFHIDKTKDFIFANDLKWTWDSNDTFFIRNELVTQDAFEKALSTGDKLSVDYKTKAGNTSSWNITSEVTKSASLSFTNPDKSTLRVQDSTYNLSGKGEAGNMIRIYRNDTFLGTATVNSSGEWDLKNAYLEANSANVFTAYQYTPGTDGENGKNSIDSATVTILAGAFAMDQVDLEDKMKDGLTIGDELVFTFSNADKSFNDAFADNQKATLIVKDGQGKTATLTVSEVKDGKNSNVLKVLDFISIDTGFANDSTYLQIDSVTGLENQDYLEFSLKDSSSKVINIKVAPIMPEIDNGEVKETEKLFTDIKTNLESYSLEELMVYLLVATEKYNELTDSEKLLVDKKLIKELQELVDNDKYKNVELTFPTI